MKKILFFMFVSVLFLNADDDWKFTGLVEIIPILDGRDFSHKTYPLNFTSMKTRAGITKSIGDEFELLVEFQDSRIWGEEGNVVARRANLDLFRGYAKFKTALPWDSIHLDLLAGRYQLDFGTGRFIGTSPWNYTERLFDGGVVSIKKKDFSLDLFAAQENSSEPYKSTAVPGNYPYPADEYDGEWITGLWAEQRIDGHRGAFFLYNEHDIFTSRESPGMILESDICRTTGGINYFGDISSSKVILEFAYQFGEMQNRAGIMGDIEESVNDISAYLFSLNFEMPLFYKISLQAGTDIISGNSPGEEKQLLFNNKLGAKHKFLGLMDYYNNLSTGTMGLGINDFHGGFGWKPGEKWALELMYHHFLSNQKDAQGRNDFGSEVDFIVRFTYLKGIFIEYGNGVYLPGSLMKSIYNIGLEGMPRTDPAFMMYIRLMAKL